MTAMQPLDVLLAQSVLSVRTLAEARALCVGALARAVCARSGVLGAVAPGVAEAVAEAVAPAVGEVASRVVAGRRMGAERFHDAWLAAVASSGGVTFADPWAAWPTARSYKYTNRKGVVCTVRLPSQARMPAARHWVGGVWPVCLVFPAVTRSDAGGASARFDAFHQAETEMWLMIRRLEKEAKEAKKKAQEEAM